MITISYKRRINKNKGFTVGLYKKVLLLTLSFLILIGSLYAEEKVTEEKVNNEAVNSLLSILKNPDQTKDLIKVLENVNNTKKEDVQNVLDNQNISVSKVKEEKKDNFLMQNLKNIVLDYFINLVQNISILFHNIIPISYIFVILIGMMLCSEIVYNFLRRNYEKKITILNTDSEQISQYSIKNITFILLKYIFYSFIGVSISSLGVFIITYITSKFLPIEADIWFPILLFAVVFPIFKIVIHVTNIPLGDNNNQTYHKKAIKLSRLYYGLCYLFYALLVAIVGITEYQLGYFIKTIIVMLWIVVNFYILKNIDYAYHEAHMFKAVLEEDDKTTYGFLYKACYTVIILIITITGIIYITQSDFKSSIFVPNKLLYCMLCLILTLSIYNIVTRMISLYIENRNKFLSNIFMNEKFYSKLQPRLALDSYVLVITSLLVLLLFVCIGLNLDFILHILLLDNVVNAINTSIGKYIFNFIIPFFMIVALLIFVKELINSLLIKVYNDKEKLNKYLSIIILLYKPYIIAVGIIYFTFVSYFFGASFSALLASTGMLTLVVTLGFKDIIASFVRVIMNILSGGFRVNDNVIISGQDGIVEDISIVYVKVRWGNGNLSLIPTASIGLIVAKNAAVSATRLDFVVDNTANYDDVVTDIKVITDSMYKDKKSSSILYKGNMKVLGITNYTSDKMTISIDLYYKTGKELEAKALYYEHLKIVTQNENSLKVINN